MANLEVLKQYLDQLEFAKNHDECLVAFNYD